jgi:hypothetical protein
MTETQVDDTIALAKFRACAMRPHRFGHSDLAEWFLLYAQGEMPLDEFLWSCDVTYLGASQPHPRSRSTL